MIDALRQIAREAMRKAMLAYGRGRLNLNRDDVADAVVDALLPCQHQTFRANNFVE